MMRVPENGSFTMPTNIMLAASAAIEKTVLSFES
jgi:hypothetical protein